MIRIARSLVKQTAFRVGRRPANLHLDKLVRATPSGAWSTAARTGPLVSILIPTYNNEDYIATCIESAISQTYTNVEIVAVDDGSSDGSFRRLSQISKQDARVSVHRNTHNVGAYQNTICCLDRSSGPLIKFLGGDDVLTQNSIERYVAAFTATPGCTLVSAATAAISASGSRIPNSRFSPRLASIPFTLPGRDCGNEVLKRTLNFIGAPTSVLISRAALLDNRATQPALWNVSRRPAFDLIWWLEALAEGTFAYVPEVLSYTRMHEASTTAGRGASTRLAAAWWEILATAKSRGYLGTSDDEFEAVASLLVVLVARLVRPGRFTDVSANAKTIAPRILACWRRLRELDSASPLHK